MSAARRDIIEEYEGACALAGLHAGQIDIATFAIINGVLATQAHLLDCLVTGRPAESEGREYLKTVALVEDCYRLAETCHPGATSKL